MPAVDAKDHRLLSMLRANARASVADIARRLCVSRATVQNRIHRLERSGVILGYTVRVSDETTNAAIRALMSIRADSTKEAGVIANLRGNPHVARVHHTTGQWDLITEIETDSLASFNTIIGAIRLIDGVISTETNLLLESYD